MTFAESFYSATHRDTDPMVHTHNLVIRIINYYVLCAHNIQLWQETTHNPRQSISDLFKNKLNVLGSKLVVQDNLFEVQYNMYNTYSMTKVLVNVPLLKQALNPGTSIKWDTRSLCGQIIE